MKYVRTKDSVNLLRKSVDAYIIKDNKYSFEVAIDEETLLKRYKVADNIEELIDGYYLDIDNHPFESTYTFDSLHKALEERQSWLSYSNRKGLDYDIVLYGFIKTDEGLIYVAKANDEEELELL